MCVCVCVCVCVCASYTIHILHVQQGGEPAKHSIALPCLLSGGENEDRKWADGTGEQGNRGEWRDERRLRKMREKGTDDWRDRKRKGWRPAGMDKWLEESREAGGVTLESVLRANQRHYDGADIGENGEKREGEGRKNTRSVKRIFVSEGRWQVCY